jgi:hypothetical protein
MSAPCHYIKTCQYRLRHGDTLVGCTANAARGCNGAVYNRIWYPLIHVVRMPNA